MRTVRSSGRPGGVSTRHTPTRHTPPRDETLPGPGTHPPGSRHPPGPGTHPQSRHPPSPRSRHTPQSRHLHLRGQTHACEHITLPQTSFAGGKNPRQALEDLSLCVLAKLTGNDTTLLSTSTINVNKEPVSQNWRKFHKIHLGA